MSVRHEPADATRSAPSTRGRIHLAAPTGVSLITVVAVAALMTTIIFGFLGPGSSPIPPSSVTAEPTATAVPTASPEPTLTPEPSPPPTAEPTPVITPTPAPTPDEPISWVGIDWSAAVVPFPHESGTGWPGISTVIDDIIRWDGEYIGVGAINDGGLACSEAAFFRSADGLHWEITFRAPSGDDRTPTMCPRFVAPQGAGLIAVAQERIWRSSDGIAWDEIDPTGLRGVWTSRGEELIDVAAGPAGIVVIGRPMNTYDSIVSFSDDGLTWSDIDLPAREEAIAWDVTAWRGRFVIVGRDGRPDEGGAPLEPYTHPGVGAPAAWTSTDGRSWTEAEVEGDAVRAGALSQVLAGSGGLMAIGNDSAVDVQYEEINELGVGAWSSVDGSTWEKIGNLDELVLRAWMLESDGTHIVALRDDGAVWLCADGRVWHPLAASGGIRVPPFPFLRVQVHEATALSAWDWKLWVTPSGLVYEGTSDDGWATKEFQVGTAVLP